MWMNWCMAMTVPITSKVEVHDNIGSSDPRLVTGRLFRTASKQTTSTYTYGIHSGNAGVGSILQSVDLHDNALGWLCRFTAPLLESAKLLWGVREITIVVPQFDGERNVCKKSRCAIPDVVVPIVLLCVFVVHLVYHVNIILRTMTLKCSPLQVSKR